LLYKKSGLIKISNILEQNRIFFTVSILKYKLFLIIVKDGSIFMN